MALKTIKRQKGFKIEFNGSSTYFITDSNGDVWGRASSRRGANIRLKKIVSTQKSKGSGLSGG